MKVAFFITSSLQAKGGHYYSLLETAEALRKSCDILIISIGINKSPVLERFKGNYIHIKEEGILETFKKVRRALSHEDANIYHSFDSRAYFYVRVLSLIHGVPNVLTKCGGGNAKHYPTCDELILYSVENLEFYKSNKRFSKTNITLLPNRVSVPKQDKQRIRDIKSGVIEDVPVILRVTRITAGYERSILQAVRLVELLRKEGVITQLLVVGTIQDSEVFERLRPYENEYVKFVTDNRYNINASQLLDVADIIVGTGRGFMEGASLGKIMLAPTDNTEIPVLVNENTFFDVFKYNFSQRFTTKLSTREALNEIVQVLTTATKNSNAEFIDEMAREFFIVDKISEKYMDIYMRVGKPSFRALDILKQYLIKLWKFQPPRN